MNLQFEIEEITVISTHVPTHAYVRARIITPQNVIVSQGSTLGGVRLANELKKLDQFTFLFELEMASESSRLRKGEIVVLQT